MDEELSSYCRIYSVADSDFCSVSADIIMYEWDYKQFLKLENYVNFSEDRKTWAERDSKRVNNNN